jgi:hypothetical protein
MDKQSAQMVTTAEAGGVLISESAPPADCIAPDLLPESHRQSENNVRFLTSALCENSW